MADERNYSSGVQNDLRGQYVDRSSGYRDTANAGIADSRNLATAGINGIRGNYTSAANGVTDDFFNRQYNNQANLTNGLTNSADTLAQRQIAALNDRFGNLFQSRSLRGQMMGSASQGYTSAATDAINNRGAASAAGSIGVGNAINDGLSNGLDLYARMGGFSNSGGGYGSTPPSNWQAPWIPPGNSGWFS
jgi:hypothetical protein